MRRVLSLSLFLLLGGALSLAAHDLFLKPARFHAAPNGTVAIRVLNGTFSKSENAVARDRVRDIRVASPAGVTALDADAWRDVGDTSVLTVRTGDPGTYVVGVSTRARSIRLSGEEFNGYLESDGLPDALAERRRAGTLADSAHEMYSKHVKTLIQVGESRTAGFDAQFGYPAELVPLDNPYRLRAGATLRLRALVDGQPVPNQFVVAGGRTPNGDRIRVRTARTDSSGVVRIPLGASGQWYVKFIHMVAVTGDSVNYESKWATLTFRLR